MSTTLKALTPLHGSLLAGMHHICFVEPWDGKAMASLLDTPGTFGWLAMAEQPQGFILCRAAAGEGEVLTLLVLPPYRRQGLAGTLLQAGGRSARQAGAAEMFLEVAADNVAAQALYAAHDFIQVGRRPRYYRGLIDALVLRRDLTSLA